MKSSIQGFHMPRYQDIPNMGLYLEQTTKYLNHFLAPLGCMEVTSSMVSNYVKKGLIPSPVKKQYGADQIAYLFFIAVAFIRHVQLDDMATPFSLKCHRFLIFTLAVSPHCQTSDVLRLLANIMVSINSQHNALHI